MYPPKRAGFSLLGVVLAVVLLTPGEVAASARLDPGALAGSNRADVADLPGVAAEARRAEIVALHRLGPGTGEELAAGGLEPATAAAAALGEPVEVLAYATEFARYLANPDGTLSFELHAAAPPPILACYQVWTCWYGSTRSRSRRC